MRVQSKVKGWHTLHRFFFQASFSGSGLEGTISAMDGDDGRASEIGEGEEEDVD